MSKSTSSQVCYVISLAKFGDLQNYIFFNLYTILIQKSDVCILQNVCMVAILNVQNGRLLNLNFVHISAPEPHRVTIFVSIPIFMGERNTLETKQIPYIES